MLCSPIAMNGRRIIQWAGRPSWDMFERFTDDTIYRGHKGMG